jgi:hypothetical protein
MKEYPYFLKMYFMLMGMDDYDRGFWRVELLPEDGECRSYYAAGWAMMLNTRLFEPSPYGDL